MPILERLLALARRVDRAVWNLVACPMERLADRVTVLEADVERLKAQPRSDTTNANALHDHLKKKGQ